MQAAREAWGAWEREWCQWGRQRWRIVQRARSPWPHALTGTASHYRGTVCRARPNPSTGTCRCLPPPHPQGTFSLCLSLCTPGDEQTCLCLTVGVIARLGRGRQLAALASTDTRPSAALPSSPRAVRPTPPSSLFRGTHGFMTVCVCVDACVYYVVCVAGGPWLRRRCNCPYRRARLPRRPHPPQARQARQARQQQGPARRQRLHQRTSLPSWMTCLPLWRCRPSRRRRWSRPAVRRGAGISQRWESY